MTDQSPCTVVEAVRQDLLDRSRVGQSKYGTTLGNAGLSQRETLQHAYEEALDLANYLKTEIMRLDAKPKLSEPVACEWLDETYEAFLQRTEEALRLRSAQWAATVEHAVMSGENILEPSEQVACEDAPIDILSGQEMGWAKVGNKSWRKGKVTINVQWQPFNRKDMILVNDGVTTYYATDMTDAFKMGERLL